jgi:hypothetical protein
MPTLSIHLPPKTYKQLRAAMGKKQTPSAFGRYLIERQLALLPVKVSLGSMKGLLATAPDFDPSAPVIPINDYAAGDSQP